MTWINYLLIAFNIFFICVVASGYDESRKRGDSINRRIDGLHERMDTLRDFMMQRFENDIQSIKNKLHKELQ